MPILGITASSILKETGSYKSIATFTATGGETTMVFSSIPQTYTHLQMRGSLRYSTNTNGYGFIYIQINGSGSQSCQQLSSGSEERGSSGLLLPRVASSSGNTANVFGSFVADFIFYTQTNTQKIALGYGGTPGNTGSYNGLGFGSGLSADTAAITSISVNSPFGEPLVANSTFALYGIKGV
jgi:hypothetical protein